MSYALSFKPSEYEGTPEQCLELWLKTRERFKAFAKANKKGELYGYVPSCQMCYIFRDVNDNCNACLWGEEFGKCESGGDLYDRFSTTEEGSKEELEILKKEILPLIGKQIKKWQHKVRNKKAG